MEDHESFWQEHRRPILSLGATVIVSILLGLCVLALATALLLTPAGAHQAPKGWSYDYSCCSSIDCREVPYSAIREDSRGYTIVRTGELIRYGDSRIKRSKDEFYHWCSAGGLDDSRSLCLYVPDRGF